MLQGALLVTVKLGTRPVDVKHEHGHGDPERRRLAPAAGICLIFQ